MRVYKMVSIQPILITYNTNSYNSIAASETSKLLIFNSNKSIPTIVSTISINITLSLIVNNT